jgi:hypothetical protein
VIEARVGGAFLGARTAAIRNSGSLSGLQTDLWKSTTGWSAFLPSFRSDIARFGAVRSLSSLQRHKNGSAATTELWSFGPSLSSIAASRRSVNASRGTLTRRVSAGEATDRLDQLEGAALDGEVRIACEWEEDAQELVLLGDIDHIAVVVEEGVDHNKTVPSQLFVRRLQRQNERIEVMRRLSRTPRRFNKKSNGFAATGSTTQNVQTFAAWIWTA